MHVHNEPTIKASLKDIETLTDDEGKINPARLNALLTEAYRMGANEWVDVQVNESVVSVPTVFTEREPEATDEADQFDIRTKADILRDGLNATDVVENFIYQCEPDKAQLRDVFHAALPQIIELAQSGAYTGAAVEDYMPTYHELQENGGADNDNPIERMLWHCTPPDGEGRFRELLRQMIEGV